MKRFFTYIAMLTLAVACSEELYGPEETPLTPDTAGSVDVSFSEVTDNSFKVTVTPTGNVSYYSYLVDASETAEELDPQTLFEVGYASVAQGTVKYTAEAPSYSFVVSATPNTTYQVYAVAGSEMSFAGEIVVKSVKTTDTVAPGYVSVDSEENAVMFTFSENVTRNAEAGAIKVAYYAPYSSAFRTQAAAAGEVTVPEEGIMVAGNKTLITVPDLPTGCYWTIDIPAGAYVDVVGQPLPAYKSTIVMTEEGPAPKGFYGQVSYVELPMLGEVELELLKEWDSGILVPLVNTYPLAGFSSMKFVTVTCEIATANSTSSTVYTLEPGVNYNVTSLGFVVTLPEEPANGANVTISIPAGCVYDIYGNDCAAAEITTKYVSGYTLDDIVGTYVAAETSAFDGSVATSAMTIAVSDDESKGNVMFTEYWDLECKNPIYATFDLKTGTLTIPSMQVFADVTLSSGGSASCMFVTGTVVDGSLTVSDQSVNWYLDGPNMIVGPSAYYGIYAVDPATSAALGWFDAYYNIEASLSSSAAVASASVLKKIHNAADKVNFTL